MFDVQAAYPAAAMGGVPGRGPCGSCSTSAPAPHGASISPRIRQVNA